MKNQSISILICVTLSLIAFSCQKENITTTRLSASSQVTSDVEEREGCALKLTVLYSSLPNWDASVQIFLGGVWLEVAHIGGPTNNFPGVIQLEDGETHNITLGGYQKMRVVQTNGSVNYGMLSPSGRFSKVVYANSFYEFFAGCDLIPSCDMTVRIGNACETTWEAQIIRSEANGTQTITHVGGVDSNAPVKIKTGKFITLFITGFTSYTFVQLSGTTNYIVNVPSEEQFSFTLDVINGANPCQANASLPGSFQRNLGCTG